MEFKDSILLNNLYK